MGTVRGVGLGRQRRVRAAGVPLAERRPDDELAVAGRNRTGLAQLRQIITNNSFVSKDVAAVARGTIADQATFVVSGTNERLPLAAPAEPIGDAWRLTMPAPDKQ